MGSDHIAPCLVEGAGGWSNGGVGQDMSGPAEITQSGSARSMTKSGGDKTGQTKRAARSRKAQDETIGEQESGAETVLGADLTHLAEEARRLREELAIERQRSEKLEAARVNVATRLDKAIASIRQLLERQG